MKLSNLFNQTLRDAPSDVEITSHKLLLRAGYIRQLAAGIFSYLPLGLRAKRKIEDIIREEIDAIGGQEITMPVVHPGELWQESGRWYKIDEEMGRFKDRGDRDMALAMTHEEVVADLARNDIQSYRQLPRLVYQIQTKFRDDPRPRAGLIRAREFTMKDSYSLDRDWNGLLEQYRRHYTAYFRIFSRVGLYDVISVESDTGIMGGEIAHEFMYLTPIGEDTLVLCDNCSYAANRQIATFEKPAPPDEDAKPRQKVETPDCKTIAALAEFLDIPESHTGKVVFLMAELPNDDAEAPEAKRNALVMAIVRGDMDVNDTKLRNAIAAGAMRPAQEDEIEAVGAVPGYASPIGIDDENVLVVIDDLVARSPNLVSGANDAGYHFINVNAGRDYEADVVADIASAYEGAACPECGAPVRLERGVEVGNIFQLGTHFSDSLGATFLDEDGEERPIVMGSYGIGVGRLLACVAEAYNDDYGLKLPITVAPYEVHLLHLGDDEDIIGQAESLYESMQGKGFEVLYDDRSASPGVKFNDADLIGAPLRVVVSSRSLSKGGIEVKRRDEDESQIVGVRETIGVIHTLISDMRNEVAAQVCDVRYSEMSE